MNGTLENVHSVEETYVDICEDHFETTESNDSCNDNSYIKSCAESSAEILEKKLCKELEELQNIESTDVNVNMQNRNITEVTLDIQNENKTPENSQFNNFYDIKEMRREPLIRGIINSSTDKMNEEIETSNESNIDSENIENILEEAKQEDFKNEQVKQEDNTLANDVNNIEKCKV